MRKRVALGIVGIAAVGISTCTWAWMDGGREPVRDIVTTIPVPELPR